MKIGRTMWLQQSAQNVSCGAPAYMTSLTPRRSITMRKNLQSVMLSLSKHLSLLSGLLLVVGTAHAQEFANIEYLCADWGPAMTLPAKTNELPRFSETEEEIYFLKQVGRFTRNKRLVPDMFSGSKTVDIGHGTSIYLCKMKPDGSGKTEIKELWHDVRYPIDTQVQSCWLDANEKTKKIALSIVYAGSDLAGLWTVNLDGSDLKRIITPERRDKRLQAIDGPSWTLDGDWIVFGESWRGGDCGVIAKCDKDGKNLTRLTEGPRDCQPRVSPDGKTIAFIRWIIKGKVHDSWLWLMALDGTNNHPLPNPQAKPNWSAQAHWGTYPAWSPDGKSVFLVGTGVIDLATGKNLGYGAPKV
jgi:WD40-like Beta Propeller Repeat